MNADDPADVGFTLTLRGPRVVYGPGVAHANLSAELDLLGARRVLLVTSPRERKARADLLETVHDRIAEHIDDIRRHVPKAIAESAVALARRLDADCLLSLGGGSAVGTAKAVAVETGLPIVALPTTYAGSEVTPLYGITSDAVKRTARSDRALPRTVLLDPLLSVDLPPDLTRSSAANALAHCVGGIFAAGHSPVTDLLAVAGTRRLVAGLRSVLDEPTGPRARGDLAQGAHLAGTVLAHAGSSAHHQLCHVLGGAFDLPHAELHAALLPHSLAFMRERQPTRTPVLDDAFLGHDPVTTLLAVSAPPRLRDLGLGEEQLRQATDLVPAAVPGIDRDRAGQLLREAW